MGHRARFLVYWKNLYCDIGVSPGNDVSTVIDGVEVI